MDKKCTTKTNTNTQKPVRVYITAKEAIAASKNPTNQRILDVIKVANGIKG